MLRVSIARLAVATRQPIVFRLTRSLVSSPSVYAPPRRPNLYISYSNAVRAQVKEEFPDYSMAEQSKEIGARFKALSDGERAEYQAKYEAERARYVADLEQYTRTLNPRPKSLSFSAQLRDMYVAANGTTPTSLESLHEFAQTLSVEKKEELKNARKQANVKISAMQKAWDKDNQDGLNRMKELKQRRNFQRTAKQFYEVGKKRKWKTLANVNGDFDTLSESDDQFVRDLKHDMDLKSKRYIRKKLQEEGFDSVALLI